MHRVRQYLHELAYDLWWTSQPEVIELFRALDPARWRETNHNPIAALLALSNEELRARIVEHSLEARVNFHHRRLQDYLNARTWCDEHAPALRAQPLAYFSAEFALHESLPLYSGGLGVLAGDFLKSASDLGLPLVGVGLYYANGYFRQRLDDTGWQREDWRFNADRMVQDYVATSYLPVAGAPSSTSAIPTCGSIPLAPGRSS